MVKSVLAVSVLGLSALIEAAPMQPRAAGKRGLAYNTPALTKLWGSAGGKVSWMYNWASAPGSGVQSGLEYVPMFHDNSAGTESSFKANAEAAIKAGSTHILSLNEPDQCGGGGACIQNVATAVTAHKNYVQPLAVAHPNVKIVSPAVTNGVKDPVTGAAMGVPYLESFLKQCTGCRIDACAAHWYDAASNVAYFKSHLQDVHNACNGKPVWLTEFGATGDTNGFLAEVLPWLDQQSWIERYSYQWVAPNSLVNAAGNGLTQIGSTYATAA